MASRVSSKPTAKPANDIDNYDLDDDPFAESGDDISKTAPSKKRKDASGLGIDEAVSVNKKQRVPRVKLDEARLLSDNGIPKLRAKAKNLRFKGKGHEFSDTARLLSLYQLWLDDLFPKAKFLDALGMVEKAGHKNQMRLKRIQWIDEGRPGRATGAEPDEDDDLFGDSNQAEERDPALFPARVAPIFANMLNKGDDNGAPDSDDLIPEDVYGASPKQPTNTTSNVSSLFGNGGLGTADAEPDEDELDALMAEEEAQRTTAAPSIFGNGNAAQATHTQHRPSHNDDDADDLDAIMAEAEAASQTTKPTTTAHDKHASNTTANNDNDNYDDDLDALMAEAEANESAINKMPSQKLNSTSTKQDGMVVDHGIDEDEEAAMAEMEGLW